MVKELRWSDACLLGYCNVNLIRNAEVSTVLEPLQCNYSVKRHQAIMVLWPFLSSAFEAQSEWVNWLFNWASSILSLFEPPGFQWSDPVWPQVDGLYLEATTNWHVQHRFSECMCNIASLKCKKNFLTKGCNGSSKIVLQLTFQRTISDGCC